MYKPCLWLQLNISYLSDSADVLQLNFPGERQPRLGLQNCLVLVEIGEERGMWVTEGLYKSGDVERNEAKKKKTEGHGPQEWGELDTAPCELGIPNSPARGMRTGVRTPCVWRVVWAVLNSVQLKPCLRMSSKESKQKPTQPTCWNMAGYHWLEWNFTPAEAYSGHDPIFGKINMNVSLHPKCKLFEGDKAREGKYKSFYRPGCQLTSCFVSSLPSICSAERKTWVFLCNVCEWIGLFIFTLVCLSSINKIRSDYCTLLTTWACWATPQLLPLQPSQKQGQSNSAQCTVCERICRELRMFMQP